MKEWLKDPIVDKTKEELERLEIEAVLFDLDDTLIYTSEIFIQCMKEYATQVAEEIGIEASKIMTALESINNEEYKKMGVNPKRWSAVVEKLANELGQGDKEILENLNLLMRIYSIEPRMRQGVRGMLEVIKKTGVKMVLVTHANVDWTSFKLDRLGLWDYFEVVIIVDENGHKKSLDWKKGMDEVGIVPEKCLIVGDSLGGDIRTGDDLGAKTIWLPSPWTVYREGEVPEKTVVVNEIFEVLAALDQLG